MCWEHGRLRFFDSMTESYLPSHREEPARAEAEDEARRGVVTWADRAWAEGLQTQGTTQGAGQGVPVKPETALWLSAPESPPDRLRHAISPRSR